MRTVRYAVRTDKLEYGLTCHECGDKGQMVSAATLKRAETLAFGWLRTREVILERRVVRITAKT